jgi:hypothetical protein
MRRRARSLLLVTAACSVPGKEPVAPDADLPGNDAGVRVAPETTIVEAPPELSATSTARFVFRADVEDATFECSTDGGRPSPCSSPLVLALADGPHQLSVRAVLGDIARDETPAVHTWTIDTRAPDTRLAVAPPALDHRDEATFELASDEMYVTFDCALDGEDFAPCPSELSLSALSDGAHVFAARARDRAGNVDISPAIHVWVIDTIPPDTLLLDGPNETTGARIAIFSFVSPDAGSGASFECALDDAPFASCTSPHETVELADGAHVFAVRARDAAGNVDPAPAMWSWRVDATVRPRPTSGRGAGASPAGASTRHAPPRSLEGGP